MNASEKGAPNGRDAWERLRRLAGSVEVQGWIEREFPSQLPRLATEVGRRDFLHLMGASLALAGFGSCTRQPREEILPFARAPEDRVPGLPLFYATAMTLHGAAQGLLVESHEGRPTKVEGNPEHPSSLGATGVFAQAAILSLYDPDRSQVVLHAGEISTYEAFVRSLRDVFGGAAAEGAGVRLLTPAVVSPTLAAQIRAFLAARPEARWHQYEPLHADGAVEGARLAFGRPVATRYRFDAARIVLALDADFLGAGPAALRYARDFVDGRRVRAEQRAMNRLYAVEPAPSVTGAFADHRLALRPSELEPFARQLARELGLDLDAGAAPDAERLRFVRALARDLRESSGAGAVVAGDGAPPAVHALAHWMNQALGNTGRTVLHSAPVEAEPVNHVESLRELAADVRAGRVQVLFVLGGNPVYDAPADLALAEALDEVPYRAHLAPYEDETSRLCHWHLPEAHFLESWSDARAHDGTASIVQPLIAPLYGGRTAHEILAALLDRAGLGAHELVREHWRSELAALEDAEFERAWKTALHDGLVRDSELPPLELEPAADLAARLGPPPARAEGLEVAFRPDSGTWDGRFANNGWLQEQPRPLTRLTWDNAVLVGPRTAAELGLAAGDVVELSLAGRNARGPLWVQPGQVEGAVTLHVGYGRTQGGRVAAGVGFDAYALRTSSAPWWTAGLGLARTGRRHAFASVQEHRRMEGRDLVRVATVDRFDELRRPSPFHGEKDAAELSLFPRREYPERSWGMVIDLNACIGCNACMVACQAENNVPIVGRSEVANGREMHWLRIDVYHEGEGEKAGFLHQPIPCMHCETAPCEIVCPVGATVHGPEGLNEMVYNRCVGTRYCANNCPYKVRRFNFYHYAKTEDEVRALGRNPDVTVRTRGVMEKCTYCVQRINAVRIRSKLEDRKIRDGEVVTACQQACPTQAIAFGDMLDPTSRLSALRREPHHYGLLEELGTRPHTTYLGRLRNPNPELAAELDPEAPPR